MDNKNTPNGALESEHNNRDLEREHSPTQLDAVPAEIGDRWERLKSNYLAAGQAFLHSVIVGLEIVRLKLSNKHGVFGEEIKKHIPDIAQRTIRRYRQIGEWYLSGAHSRIVTVAELKKNKSEPVEQLCTDEAVDGYLKSANIRNADDLRENAIARVPDLAKPRTSTKGSRVQNLMAKFRRAWSRMNDEQKVEFVRCFDEFRSKPPKVKSASAVHAEKAAPKLKLTEHVEQD